MNFLRDLSRLALPLSLLAIFVLAAFYILFTPPERLALSRANGSYINSCCAPIRFADGSALAGKAAFKYVIEIDKVGPYILPVSSLVSADDEGLSVVTASNPLKIRLDASINPEWVDILGHDGETRRFIRRG